MLSISVVEVGDSSNPPLQLAVKLPRGRFETDIEEMHSKLLKICRESSKAKTTEEIDKILSDRYPDGAVLVSSVARWQDPWITYYLPKFASKLQPQRVDIKDLGEYLRVLGYPIPSPPPKIISNALQKAQEDAKYLSGIISGLNKKEPDPPF